MLTQLEGYDLSQIVQPFQRPETAQQDAMRPGPNLTVQAGRVLAIKTADKLGYPFLQGAGDGTQNAVGISMYAFQTDANSNVFLGNMGTTAGRLNPPWTTIPFWKSGIFAPEDIFTVTPVAQIDTFTPATIEVGDVFTLTYTSNALQTTSVSFVATATTAANVSAGVIAAWNANPVLAGIATATGASTVILTATKAGRGFSVASSTTNGGAAATETFTRAATQANVGLVVADLLAACPGTRLLHNGAIQLAM